MRIPKPAMGEERSAIPDAHGVEEAALSERPEPPSPRATTGHWSGRTELRDHDVIIVGMSVSPFVFKFRTT